VNPYQGDSSSVEFDWNAAEHPFGSDDHGSVDPPRRAPRVRRGARRCGGLRARCARPLALGLAALRDRLRLDDRNVRSRHAGARRGRPIADLKVGDVITYRPPAGAGHLITHRIAWIGRDGSGQRSYRTKGDANATADPWTFRLGPTQARVTAGITYAGTLFTALWAGAAA
jgi:hypothetical protein